MPSKNKEKDLENRLVGWLVSYALDQDGFTYEIRSGRTLIGSGKKNNGIRLLTLEENTISDPHLAMNASTKHRVYVQDIFSDAGSFIVRSASGREEDINGPVELKHGDWIKIGKNTRFQVCLIDGPSSN